MNWDGLVVLWLSALVHENFDEDVSIPEFESWLGYCCFLNLNPLEIDIIAGVTRYFLKK